MRIFALCTVAALAAVSSVGVAQNASLRANFGSITLNSGFTPDPYRVNVVAGGSLNAPGGCAGSISDAPDFELTYNAGSLPLAFRTSSNSDTTLIINDPAGNWVCDDDSGGNRNAQVVFRGPRSGVYDVWVGTFGGGTAQAELQITELP